MARTSEGATLTRQHRQAQLALRAATLRDLQRLWPMISARDLSRSFGSFAEAARPLIVARHRDSAGLAAAYYQAFRTVDLAMGAAQVALAAQPNRDEVIGTLHVTGLTGIYNAVRAGQSPQAALQNGYVRTAGAVTRLVLAGGRQTVVGTAQDDRKATGWAHVTSGDSCDFCTLLASRGAAYKSERTSNFEAHDHCGCTAEPAF